MKRNTSFIVILLLTIYIFSAGVFFGQPVQNVNATWVNKVSYLSYSNTPQAKFKTYVDTCSTLGCYVRILEQEDVPTLYNAVFFNWIADPAEVLPVPDSVKITAKMISTDPENLPIVRLKVKLLQKTNGGGYFSEEKDINSTWNTYTWGIDYQEAPSFEGFGVGVTVGQSPNAMKAIIAMSRVELWRNGSCYYVYSFSRTAVAIETPQSIPSSFQLSQNYPNPFNPATVIKFKVPSSQVVTLKVYDMLGREVAVLVDGEKSVGVYEVRFNASTLASGTYIYRLQAGHQVISRKMVLLK